MENIRFLKKESPFNFRESKTNIIEKQYNKNVILNASINLQDTNVYNTADYISIQRLRSIFFHCYVAKTMSEENDIYEVSCIKKQESKCLV